MKLKKKMLLQNTRIEKVSIPGEIARLLDSYDQYYIEVYKDKISTSDLIVEMMTAFMKSDRDFMKYIREKESVIEEISS